MYKSPGNADSIPDSVAQSWDRLVTTTYQSLSDFHSRFFEIDPAAVQSPVQASASWFGDPAEPAFCLDQDWARKLSDWDVRGRHALHNEYLEYVMRFTRDASGRRRLKQVHFTTELREYWVTLAVEDSRLLQQIASTVLGFTPTWMDLYGVGDPSSLKPLERKIAFSTQVAGHGNDEEMIQHGVPAQPLGALNRANALFMTHPINGLDDLLYIVMFGAKPYARQGSSGLRPATKEQIFRSFGVEHLACRHADPSAATAAHQQAFQGKPVAFANPLGVYFLNFTDTPFQYRSAPVPREWIRFSRGDSAGRYQRLEFGPSMTEDVFLDEVEVIEGDDAKPLTGGFEIARRIEVGPNLLIGSATQVKPAEYVVLTASTAPIDCGAARVCESIRRLKQDYESMPPTMRMGPRDMSSLPI